MDFQHGIIDRFAPEQDRLLQSAATVLQAARQAGMRVIYVVVQFREGYPEISRRNKRFHALSEQGWLKEGSAEVQIHSGVAPQDGDVIVTKRRVGAYAGSDLEAILRAGGIETLVMFGVATSGVVLSTVRWAADMDYRIVVLSDCCADADDEVHRVLTDKVFAAQATVATSQDFLQDVTGSPAA